MTDPHGDELTAEIEEQRDLEARTTIAVNPHAHLAVHMAEAWLEPIDAASARAALGYTLEVIGAAQGSSGKPDIPRFGSPEWARCRDPLVRLAGVAAAAHAWLETELLLPARAQAEIEQRRAMAGVGALTEDERAELLRRLDEREPAIHAEIDAARQARADERAAFAAPRPGDHPGGPVAWEPQQSRGAAA